MDHIITNDTMHTIYPSVIVSNLTDHYPNMCQITSSETTRKTKKEGHFQRQKWFNLELFNDEMAKKLGETYS